MERTHYEQATLFEEADAGLTPEQHVEYLGLLAKYGAGPRRERGKHALYCAGWRRIRVAGRYLGAALGRLARSARRRAAQEYYRGLTEREFWIALVCIILIGSLLNEAILRASLLRAAGNETVPETIQRIPQQPILTNPTPTSAPLSTPVPKASLEGLSDPFALWQAPTMDGPYINHILCTNASPACGTGQDFFGAMVERGIDPAQALAFFAKESTYGRFGVAASTLGMGNMRCGADLFPGEYCWNGWRAYHDWATGYKAWADRMTRLYKTGAICAYTSMPCNGPLLTLDQIVPVYAPPVENDTPGYIAFLKQRVTDWRGNRV